MIPLSKTNKMRDCLIDQNLDKSSFNQSLNSFYGMKLNDEQKQFRDSIVNNDIDLIVVNAKAGTGKTTIAVGAGALLVKYGFYKNIVYVVSPTQEMVQGFIPGSIEDKSAPYMEPLKEALIKCNYYPEASIFSESNMMSCKNGTAFVRCMTHTFLRGCNIENSIVIIEEAQNYYFDSLKKVLTRCHDNNKVIIIGHTEQCDLYKNAERSGFKIYLDSLSKDIEDGKVTRAKICQLTKNYRGWISNWADNVQFNYQI